MIPEALREPNLFDHTLEELTFSYDKNRQVKVHSTIAAEAKSNREAEILRNRTAEDSPKTPNTESTADTSSFYTPDSEKNLAHHILRSPVLNLSKINTILQNFQQHLIYQFQT